MITWYRFHTHDQLVLHLGGQRQCVVSSHGLGLGLGLALGLGPGLGLRLGFG